MIPLSPIFLCQVAIVASATDSGKAGTLTSIDMLIPSLIKMIRLECGALVSLIRLVLPRPVVALRANKGCPPRGLPQSLDRHNAMIAQGASNPACCAVKKTKHPGFVALPDTK